MAKSHYASHIQNEENLRRVEQERLLLETASLIYRTMKAKGITRTALAAKLGVTKGRISQYLGGERNLRLRTLADIFTAMGSELVISAVERVAEESIDGPVPPEDSGLGAPTGEVSDAQSHRVAASSLPGA